MLWNWQHPDWPEFVYDPKAIESEERRFLLESGAFIGAYRHLQDDDKDSLRIELISDEAIKTSAIEGEILNRDTVQSSLRHQLGLGPNNPKVQPKERGVAQMMLDLYANFAEPLTEQMLFDWHRMLLSSDNTLQVIGGWRTHEDPMQVVSGPDYKRKVHFEAPASKSVPKEMQNFITWFNDSGPEGKSPLSALTRAGIAHLYFESIHPFEDGNGRIGRAISEKALAQNLGQPSLTALAYAIERKRKDYYAALERNQSDIEITAWLRYFARTTLEAQDTTTKRVEFYLAKAKFYERFREKINERQEKVIARIFREGIDGFKGGLSAENYISITDTSRATATRDLQDLVEKGALKRTGALRHTRYWLNLSNGDT